MQNNFQLEEDNIGIDPTMMPTIDSLDVEPRPLKKEKKKKKERNTSTPNPDKKPHELLKKVLFTISVLALMAGVAFGVYYYLSYGTGKRTTNRKAKFTLDNNIIYIGDSLSNNIMDYGDFSTVDISECTLDLTSVDVNIEGTYDYSVVCGSVKYTANIIVKQRAIFDLETTIVYKNPQEEININEFIKTEKNYEYTYLDNNVNDYMNSAGGPYSIGIKVKNEKNEEMNVYGVLYVVASKPLMSLTCNSSKLTDGDYNYNIIDRISFDNNRNNMNISLRMYNYTFATDLEYEKMEAGINDGKIKINDHEGIVLMNKINKSIKIVNILENETLSSEYGRTFPTSYNEINSYYRNTKKYSCSI